MSDSFVDNDFGLVIIKRNNRAKRLIVRRSENHFSLTVPLNYPLDKIKDHFEAMKPRLHILTPRKTFLLDETTQLITATFALQIVRHSLQNYYYALKDGVLRISCPMSLNLHGEEEQSKIKSILESVLRGEARRYLPSKLEELSKRYGFSYSGVKINKSRTRWGSCSSKGGINLSYYSMFLPVHLINFVLLHELCHTVEMNHGERFWQLLDKVTDGKAKELTKELGKAGKEAGF